jgi:hypothetical protein
MSKVATSFVRLRFSTQQFGDAEGHIGIIVGDTPGIQRFRSSVR